MVPEREGKMACLLRCANYGAVAERREWNEASKRLGTYTLNVKFLRGSRRDSKRV